MEIIWSRWFRCESSFGLLLVPNQPGIYALAEEMTEPSAMQPRRVLAVFDVDETENLASSLSRLFAAGSRWRQKLNESKCYMRYAVASSQEERRAAAGTLQHWLETQRGAAVAEALPPAENAVEFADDSDLKTVAERAVDRVTRATAYAGVFPAGI
ncbi:MAG: hypothetical protein LAO20_13705 [Acidobacteriia bacterium]|nr:hypothetical protein [Terriglobia bacterium]